MGRNDSALTLVTPHGPGAEDYPCLTLISGADPVIRAQPADAAAREGKDKRESGARSGARSEPGPELISWQGAPRMLEHGADGNWASRPARPGLMTGPN